jgi:hypothetical protein
MGRAFVSMVALKDPARLAGAAIPRYCGGFLLIRFVPRLRWMRRQDLAPTADFPLRMTAPNSNAKP